MNKNIKVVRETDYQVTLPCSQDDFTDFVKSLLGKAQTIENNFDKSFEINQGDIVSLYHLIEQRIHQQNRANLVSFTAIIHWSDDSSIQLNDIDSLATYNEIRNVVPGSLHLSFTYLIIFQQSKTPEKQEIYISFDVARGIYYAIKNTARSWGSDIDSLLTNSITEIIKKSTKPEEFQIKWIPTDKDTIRNIVITIIFIGIAFLFFLYTNNIGSIATSSMASGSSLEDISKNLNILSKFVVSSKIYVSTLTAILFSFLCLFFIDDMVSGAHDRYSYSLRFIIFNKTAESYKDGIIKRYKKDAKKAILNFVYAISLGVAANILFSAIFIW
ncbi:MAG: hypothetical protein PHI97_34940 [Desulfobulbus sp.]|nr:hypothetical protein [Desulfobulbus sp.]